MEISPTKPAMSHRQRLLKAGLAQFYANGFHGTSVDSLLAEAGAPKGSFYHHFGSKEVFARAVLNEYSAQQTRALASFAARTGLTAREKLQAYFQTMRERFVRSDHRVACLVGKFSAELAPSSDQFGALVAESMNTWRREIEQLLAQGQLDRSIRRDLTVEQLSHLVLSMIQGGLVISLANRSADTLAHLGSMLPVLLGPVTTTSAAPTVD